MAIECWFIVWVFVHMLPSTEPKDSHGIPMANISQIELAKGFNIYYGKDFKVVENFISNSSYLLLQNTPVKANPQQCDIKLKSFIVPLANYSLDTTVVPVSYLELLGLLDSLKGITSELVSSACLMEYIADGEIPKINSTDIEELLQFSAHLTSTSIPDQQCNYISFDPLGEQNPLQRAEWIKYVAAFLNYEARANHVFQMVKENYLCLSALAGKASAKPRIAWLTYSEETWSFSNETYKLQYVSDAGGTNLDESVYMTTFHMSLPSEVESFHKILSTVDVVLDESYSSAPADYTLSTFNVNAGISEYESFPFVVNESVWRYDKQVESAYMTDWYDAAVAQPQLVLGDLIQALHPQPNYATTYLRNIGKGEGIVNISGEKCAHNRSTPMEPTTVPCNDFVII